MGFFVLVATALCSLTFAQYSEQPLKESTSDLRSQTIMFSIEIPSDKKTYVLERTSGQDFFFRTKHKNDESIRKIAGRVAQSIDRDFASRFLKIQYEIASVEGSCDVTLRLNMKGERQEVCAKDDKKSQEMKPFIEDLSKRFSP